MSVPTHRLDCTWTICGGCWLEMFPGSELPDGCEVECCETHAQEGKDDDAERFADEERDAGLT